MISVVIEECVMCFENIEGRVINYWERVKEDLILERWENWLALEEIKGMECD